MTSSSTNKSVTKTVKNYYIEKLSTLITFDLVNVEASNYS